MPLRSFARGAKQENSYPPKQYAAILMPIHSYTKVLCTLTLKHTRAWKESIYVITEKGEYNIKWGTASLLLLKHQLQLHQLPFIHGHPEHIHTIRSLWPMLTLPSMHKIKVSILWLIHLSSLPEPSLIPDNEFLSQNVILKKYYNFDVLIN